MSEVEGSFGNPGKSKAESLVRSFVESCVEKDEDSFECFEDVYQAYKQLVGPANQNKLNRETFLRALKKCVECIEGVKYVVDPLPGEKQFVHRLYNIRLVKRMHNDFEANKFAAQVIARGSFVDSNTGNGKVYIVETTVLRLNYVALNAYNESTCLLVD